MWIQQQLMLNEHAAMAYMHCHACRNKKWHSLMWGGFIQQSYEKAATQTLKNIWNEYIESCLKYRCPSWSRHYVLKYLTHPVVELRKHWKASGVLQEYHQYLTHDYHLTVGTEDRNILLSRLQYRSESGFKISKVRNLIYNYLCVSLTNAVCRIAIHFELEDW